MVDSPPPAKTAVETFDDIGPEFNFSIKVSEANSVKMTSFKKENGQPRPNALVGLNRDLPRQPAVPDHHSAHDHQGRERPAVRDRGGHGSEWFQRFRERLPLNGVETDLCPPLQGGSVSCDSSHLVDPLKIGQKSHTQAFSQENLRNVKKLVGVPSTRLPPRGGKRSPAVLFQPNVFRFIFPGL